MDIRSAFFFPVLLALAAAQVPAFTITSDNLPPALPGAVYDFQLTTAGAEGPVHWAVTGGQLPPGVNLDTATGHLSGTVQRNPSRSFLFEVTATDSNSHTAKRTFTVGMSSDLILRWNPRPTLAGNALGGAVEIENRGRTSLDLTFIVVAINQVNKAFALGYTSAHK